jgi:hypothetical protein
VGPEYACQDEDLTDPRPWNGLHVCSFPQSSF